MNNLIKAKKLPIGTIRNYSGYEYVKTANGWKPNAKGGSKAGAATPTKDPKKTPSNGGIKENNKEKYTPVKAKVGQTFAVENPKSGYYNYRKVEKDLGNGKFKVAVWDSLRGTVGDGGTWSASEIEARVNEDGKREFDKKQAHKSMVEDFKKKAGYSKLVGGNLTSPGAATELGRALNRLKKAAGKYATDDSSVGAGGFSGANSSTMRSSRSGTPVKVLVNGTHHGGYYEGSKPFSVQVQIGGGINFEARQALVDAAKDILNKYSHKGNPEFEESYVTTTDGTNWVSAMMVSPRNSGQYNPLPEFFANKLQQAYAK